MTRITFFFSNFFFCCCFCLCFLRPFFSTTINNSFSASAAHLRGDSVRRRHAERAHVVRAVPRLRGPVQRQRAQPARVPVAHGRGKSGRHAVRVRSRHVALERFQRALHAQETHERLLVEQKVFFVRLTNLDHRRDSSCASTIRILLCPAHFKGKEKKLHRDFFFSNRMCLVASVSEYLG